MNDFDDGEDTVVNFEESFTVTEIREAFKVMAESFVDGTIVEDDFFTLLGFIADGMMWFDGIRDGEFTFSGDLPIAVTYPNEDIEPS